MILYKHFLISEDLFEEAFVCNLSQCKGACCIEGDSGAPLQHNEVLQIDKNLEGILKQLPLEQQDLIQEQGLFERDFDNEKVTPCLPHNGLCAYAVKDPLGVLSCGIERAYNAGESDFQKPVSCHLYPVRVVRQGVYTVLQYHRWSICSEACKLGKQQSVPVFRFVKAGLIRSFGRAFYDEMEAIFEQRFRVQS